MPFGVALMKCRSGLHSSKRLRNWCLDIDDMTSLSKFGEFTWPGSHFIGRSLFYRPPFCAIFKISIWNFRVNFWRQYWPVKFCEGSVSRNLQTFGFLDFSAPITDRPDELCQIFVFLALLWCLKSGKNFIVIRPVVF